MALAPDRIFTVDGPAWTSAGVTAGIDLALALVEQDFGRELALALARELVVFLKRPGGQSQFSAHLAGQAASKTPVQQVQAYILDHLAADLSVPALAKRAGMSERNFARVFEEDTGMTPAELVEAARLEAARRLVEDSVVRMQRVATHSGFGDLDYAPGLSAPPRCNAERLSPHLRTLMLESMTVAGRHPELGTGMGADTGVCQIWAETASDP